MHENMESPVTVRPAVIDDVDAIWQLLQLYAQRKLLLERQKSEILKHLYAFVVACTSRGEVIGCTCLRRYAEDLYEVRSLAVHETWVNQRVGSILVRRLMEDIAHIPHARLFALTYRAPFFMNLGFKSVVKEYFPEKIWNDCINCSKREHCDEDAVLYVVPEPLKTR